MKIRILLAFLVAGFVCLGDQNLSTKYSVLQYQNNLLVNGTFAVWQAGTTSSSITTTRTYLADQWAVKTGAGTLTTVARSSTVPTGSRSKYSLELTGATGVTTVTVDQRIEALNVPKGTVYFSAQIYNGSGAAFTPKLYVSTPGSSDVWTTPTVINGSGSGESLQSCADSAWTRVYWTADISSYSNIANGVEFKLEIPSGSLVSGDTVRFTDAALTYGSAYIYPLVKTQGQILYDCMRYYWIQTAVQSFGGYGYYAASTGQAMGIIVTLPVPMRIAPTVTVSGTWVTSNCGQPTASNPTTTSVSLTAAATAAGRCAFYNDAGTGLILDARL